MKGMMFRGGTAPNALVDDHGYDQLLQIIVEDSKVDQALSTLPQLVEIDCLGFFDVGKSYWCCQ